VRELDLYFSSHGLPLLDVTRLYHSLVVVLGLLCTF